MSSTKGEIEYFDIPNFTFQNGTTLDHVRLAYLQFNKDATKTALIPTCFRGRVRSTLNFAQGALSDHRVIVVALLGNGESSSPSNTLGFPSKIEYRDCVRAQHLLLTQGLGITSIDVMVGFSMGGQCTYHWLALYPQMVKKAVIICSSARTSRHNYQFLEGPRAALENSADYVAERKEVGKLEAPLGLRAFGKAYSAWLTSVAWFEDELYRELGYQSLSEWDQATTDVNYRDWDPEDLLVMLCMWQRGDITLCNEECGGSLEVALSKITAPVLLLPCRTDQYFSWTASEKEAQLLPNGKCEIIPSVWGHVAGSGMSIRDKEWIDSKIKDFVG
ncbi:Alpha/Beta hydrolase protein [Annulohypoxylon truncatum]|uniref:Alpha/Beta hydrolase protein n=1 Tax=Annulohypoxylon truncatum TaxID=327061 RepID=UPI0020072062|nr:Alpha/Beta hydrolase protein [Annulohypoxylon truncatum]KAI1214213.1 Alpha/Beta hydrolase protein [Annulohypoxylon truncatum]